VGILFENIFDPMLYCSI